jgi:2,3-diketo-5-methylthio-1-phosphopentane phosphatase
LPKARDASLPLSGCMVFFDFDNTITSFDVLDGVIEKFSINRDWVAYEEAWKQGKIGSRQCLEGQLRCIRVTRQVLCEYLSGINVDSHFTRLLALLRKAGINPVILSDSFSFMIDFILKNNGIAGVRVYANKFRFYKDSLIPSFPYTNNLCSHCAHCKTSTLSNEAFKNKIVVYAGDGLSDVCPACHADIVFAKKNCSLLKHFTETGRECLAFNDLGDIYNYFRSMQDASEAACR